MTSPDPMSRTSEVNICSAESRQVTSAVYIERAMALDRDRHSEKGDQRSKYSGLRAKSLY